MKMLSLIGAALGLIAMFIGLYHMIETYPNIVAFQKMGERTIWLAYRSAGWIQIYSIWGVGGIGLIASLGGLIKDKSAMKKAAIAGAVFSISALIMSMSTMMAGKIG